MPEIESIYNFKSASCEQLELIGAKAKALS